MYKKRTISDLVKETKVLKHKLRLTTTKLNKLEKVLDKIALIAKAKLCTLPQTRKLK